MKHVGKFVIKGAKFEDQSSSSTALEIFKTEAHVVISTFKSNTIGKYISFLVTGESLLMYSGKSLQWTPPNQ